MQPQFFQSMLVVMYLTMGYVLIYPGVVYTRWGRTVCPNKHGIHLVYSGIIGGTAYNAGGGGGANYLCLTKDPRHLGHQAGVSGLSAISGTEYHAIVGQPLGGVYAHNAPCAVCLVTTRWTQIMIPGTYSCPNGWTREYYGFLMTAGSHANRHSKTFECVDSSPESIAGHNAYDPGAILYHVEPSCKGLPCLPYHREKELTCAVCSY